MPVSVVCDAASVVNAALRESISTNSSSSSSNTTNCSTQHHQHSNNNNNNIQNNNNNVQNNSNNNTAINNNNNRNNNQNNDDDDDNTDNGQQNLQNKLIASTKRILLTKIEYEEVNNYNQTVLDTLKTKYIILKPINNNNGKTNNQLNTNSSMITLSSSPSSATVTATSKGDGSDGGDKEIAHQNSSTTTLTQNAIPVQQNGIKDPNQLPQPKCILFPRENVQIGWKNSNRKWLIGAGMANVGNTCYLNSILQALFHVPAMANWLISDIQHREQCEIENGIQNSNCIICSVARTLIASQSNQPVIRPFLIYTKLKLVCKHLILGRQEDAHEFLRYLVESMEKSYLSRFRNWKELDQYSKETTPLNQILGGYLRSTVRCLACGHISTTFQHFQDLLVDIRKADTVEDALAGFFSRERLEDMGYKCEACKKKVSATKQFSLERAPISLCIQLKRFSMLGTKLNKPVTFRTRLDLSPYASKKSNNNSNGYNSNQLTYRLVSMVIHLGTSQHCGHYTTVALTDAGGYYQFDDSSVRAASLQSVLVTNGYIMFYEIEDSRQKGQHYSSLPSTITSTKVSGEHNNTSEQIKENLQHKINGHHNNNENINSLSDLYNGLSPVSSSTSTTSSSIIGPQLPDKLLNGYKLSSESQKSKINGNIDGSVETTTHHKLVNSPTTSKLVKTSLNNETSSTSSSSPSLSIKTTTTALSQSSPKLKCNTNQTLNNKLVIHFKNTNNVNGSNPLNTKFQGVNSPTKSQLNDSNKTQTENSKNSKKSLVAIPSTSNTASRSLFLPNMPNLENSTQKSNNSLLSPSSSSLVRYPSTNKASPSTNATATTGNASNKLISNNNNSNNLTNRRSLVPYGSDDESSGNNSDSEQQQQQQRNTNAKNLPNNSTTPSTNGNNKNNGDYIVLDENSSSSTSSTTSTSNSKSPDGAKTPKTPPSPAIVKSKAGLWQVTKANVQRANTTNSSISPSSSSPNATINTSSSPLPPTTPTTTKITEKRNPFATESSISAISTSNFYSSSSNNSSSIKSNNIGGGGGKDNKNKFNKKYEGGYTENHNNTNGNTVNQLLKYSHRGYGAPVLSWNGQKPEIEKEIDEQIRLERKREIIDDEENEMDRGRQKKVKTHNNRDNSNSGYNPFQEYQNNQTQQRRWNNNGNNGNNSNNRYHGQNGNGPHIRQNNSNNPFYRNNNNNFRNNHHHNNNHNHHRRFNNNHHQRPHHQRNGGGDNNRFHHRRDS